jgi:hypothetical protein
VYLATALSVVSRSASSSPPTYRTEKDSTMQNSCARSFLHCCNVQ